MQASIGRPKIGAVHALITCLAVLVSCSFFGLARAAQQGTIPPGTVITMQNWRKYKAFMPDGMVDMFEGKYFWKMPPDVQIPIQAPVLYPLPKPFRDAVEKYGNQARLVKMPNGEFELENFVAGVPFPHPSGPYKGTEIAADVTYRPGPHLLVGFLDSKAPPAPFFSMDRFGNKSMTLVDYDYRQLAYNWMPGVPTVEPEAAGAWYTEWLMVEEPEESKYTGDLTIYYQDNLRLEDNYIFIPALRRTLRLAVSARCAPLFGSDMTHDDQRIGWNGGVGLFEGKFLRDQKVIANLSVKADPGNFPQDYDMPLGWSKPSWGKWQVMDTWVTDVRRIPSLRPGYCYGKRIMYTSKYYYANVHEDLYDAAMKLWKIVQISFGPNINCQHPEWGMQGYDEAGTILEQYWDVQNDHVTHVTNAWKGKSGDGDCYAPQYDNVAKYSTPGGLMQIMR